MNAIPEGPVGPVNPVFPVAPVEPCSPTPVAPVLPVNPITPVAPVLPTVPVNPVAPSNPLMPVAPVGPVNPITPVDPVKPVAPAPVAPVGPVSVAVVWIEPSLNLIPLASTERATRASGVTPIPTRPSALITNAVLSGLVVSSTRNDSPVPVCVIRTAGDVPCALNTAASREPVFDAVNTGFALDVTPIVCG